MVDEDVGDRPLTAALAALRRENFAEGLRISRECVLALPALLLTLLHLMSGFVRLVRSTFGTLPCPFTVSSCVAMLLHIAQVLGQEFIILVSSRGPLQSGFASNVNPVFIEPLSARPSKPLRHRFIPLLRVFAAFARSPAHPRLGLFAVAMMHVPVITMCVVLDFVSHQHQMCS